MTDPATLDRLRLADLVIQAGMDSRRSGLFASGNRDGVTLDALARFAELVRADERERCAKVCEAAWPEMHKYWGQGQARAACEDCAAAIRAMPPSP